MSFIQDAIKALDSSSDAAAKEVKASLEMLTALADSKKTEMEVLLDKRTAAAKDKHEIPPGVVLFDASNSHVVSSKGPAEGITSAVSLLLQNAEQNWKKAVGDLVNTALNVLLGGATGASSTATYYIIALDGHAADPSKTPPIEETYVPVRIDYALWVYNFKRQGLTETVESAVVYHARRSTLDYNAIPGTVQMDQALKDIGLPKQQRDDLIKQINAEENKRVANLRAYSREVTDARVRSRLAAML